VSLRERAQQAARTLEARTRSWTSRSAMAAKEAVRVLETAAPYLPNDSTEVYDVEKDGIDQRVQASLERKREEEPQPLPDLDNVEVDDARMRSLTFEMQGAKFFVVRNRNMGTPGTTIHVMQPMAQGKAKPVVTLRGDDAELQVRALADLLTQAANNPCNVGDES